MCVRFCMDTSIYRPGLQASWRKTNRGLQRSRFSEEDLSRAHGFPCFRCSAFVGAAYACLWISSGAVIFPEQFDFPTGEINGRRRLKSCMTLGAQLNFFFQDGGPAAPYRTLKRFYPRCDPTRQDRHSNLLNPFHPTSRRHTHYTHLAAVCHTAAETSPTQSYPTQPIPSHRMKRRPTISCNTSRRVNPPRAPTMNTIPPRRSLFRSINLPDPTRNQPFPKAAAHQDGDIREALRVQRIADGSDSAVHHVGRSHNIRPRAGLADHLVRAGAGVP